VTVTVRPAAVAATCQPSSDALTVEQAHQVMQEHLHCRTADCPQRQAALAVLVESEHYRLART
jgi:hypothetical protein